MSKNFWKEFNKPIICLAPMADVTDPAFRQIIAQHDKGKIFDVFWTEFVSADGLIMAPEEAKQKMLKDFDYGEEEKPIVAQLFGSNVENMEKASKMAQDLGFDGIDINMGCPDKSVEKQGSGAAMMKNPDNAKEIIKAVKRGAPNLPVSVKTRIGYNKDELETWLPVLLSEDLAAVTLHARTRKEMSKVPANWDRIKRAVEIRDELESDTLIFGNGDIVSMEQAEEKIRETGCDGVMIGRGIFGLRVFNIPHEERLRILVEHSKLFEKLLPHKGFHIMKKHFKAYVEGFDGAKELRMKLMETTNSKEVEEVIEGVI